MSRSGVATNRRRHDPDGASTGYQYIFAQQIKLQCGVHRVTQGIEQGGNIEVDIRPVLPDIRHWQAQIFSEGTLPVDTDATGGGTKMAPASHAITATPADNMTFPGDNLTGVEVIHIGTDINNFSHKFVTDNHWHLDSFLCPAIPIVDV